MNKLETALLIDLFEMYYHFPKLLLYFLQVKHDAPELSIVNKKYIAEPDPMQRKMAFVCARILMDEDDVTGHYKSIAMAIMHAITQNPGKQVWIADMQLTNSTWRRGGDCFRCWLVP